MSATLANRKCAPCQGGIPPLSTEESEKLLQELNHDWQIRDGKQLVKAYHFKSYREGLAFVNTVANIAEELDHHPDLLFTWGKVTVTIWTHKVNGLTESDFILAARIEESQKNMEKV